MSFTATTAAACAQIFAVLFLTLAFAPYYRGGLRRKWVRGDDGRMYRVADGAAKVSRYQAAIRVVVTTLLMVAVVLDTFVVIIADDLDGGPGFLLSMVNAAALGLVTVELLVAVLQHQHDDPRDGPEKDA
jgi:hypothetical protein